METLITLAWAIGAGLFVLGMAILFARATGDPAPSQDDEPRTVEDAYRRNQE